VTLAPEILSALPMELRSDTPRHLRTDAKTSVQKLREELSPEEQTLLVLRIDRGLDWREVAEVVDAEEAAVRKRFERLRDKLRKLAKDRGLLGTELRVSPRSLAQAHSVVSPLFLLCDRVDFDAGALR